MLTLRTLGKRYTLKWSLDERLRARRFGPCYGYEVGSLSDIFISCILCGLISIIAI